VYDRSDPFVSSPAADARGGSVRYAAPGSQHVVLGRTAQSEPAHDQSSVGGIDEAPAVRQRSDIEEIFRLALSMLRANW
jgi:hypothetical protein